ncbi:arylsulfatase [Sphingobacterium hungaricum]|uniref:Arylsulfatase n=1 Tax=Sphingobacterium hungaricum TaxID=2082723 RepID=A0A928YSP3_9SPHI|nr:arylsulfatase [Sphingobacterium hungaricum]MBE8714433.1 arylsulfatase [Sphingobacterium hungaricum]
MKSFLSIIFLFLIFQSLSAQDNVRKPNIVFILADDLGYGDLGAYGQAKIKTPHIDQLAKEGMRFTNFYAGTSVCAPSRSALMTGQHTGHTPIRGNKELEPEGQQPLPDSVQTIAMLLKANDYVTGAFGKWGMGMVGTSGDPTNKGFDEFFGYNCQRQSHRYYPTHLWHNQTKIELEGNDLSSKVVYAPELIQEKTLEFIEKNKDKPFFLFVPTVLPHAELAGPEDEFYALYEHAFEEKAHRGQPYGPQATIAGYTSVGKPRATFASMVTRMDAYVGQILGKLEELGLSEETIIVFSSDNGSHREGGADPDFFNSSGGLRGNKRDLYEGGIKVPLIVKWPKQIRQNVTSNYLGAFWDILPTLTDISDSPNTVYTDGISFKPTLSNSKMQKQHAYLYWEFHEDGGRQAVRMEDWKLVKLKVRNPSQSTYELYNLKNDPSESRNVVKEHVAVFEQLKRYMDEAHVETDVFPLLTKE